MDERRKKRLYWLFKQVLEQKQNVLTAERAKHFSEAISCLNDVVSGISQILASAVATSALRQSLRTDLTATAFNSQLCDFLRALQAPELTVTCGGDLLNKIVMQLLDCPLFWDEFVRHVEGQRIDVPALQCFAWLLLQILCIPDLNLETYILVAKKPTVASCLQMSGDSMTRNLYQKIMHIVETLGMAQRPEVNGPGGRHDNDFEDFRRIAITPTVNELFCSEKPYLRFAAELEDVSDEEKFAFHLDNQFRLLREDMLRDLREELSGKTKRRGQRIDGLQLIGICQEERKRWAIVLECPNGLKFLAKDTEKARAEFLDKHKKFLPHGCVVCIFADGQLVGLGELWRKEHELAAVPLRVSVMLSQNEVSTQQILIRLHSSAQIQLIQLNTAIFAYEPILKQLQNTRLLPIASEFLTWRSGQAPTTVSGNDGIRSIMKSIEKCSDVDLQPFLGLRKRTRLDENQAKSLTVGLTQQLALIQGPPGTGKSFIGALVAKALYTFTSFRILVLSYTNHALDQYLEDLLDVGIPARSVVRLGPASKATTRTKPLTLYEQILAGTNYRRTRGDYELIESRKSQAKSAGATLTSSFKDFFQSGASKVDLFDYLEFSTDFFSYFEAFQVPDQSGDFSVVGEDGKVIDEYYLLTRWIRGKDAGVFQGQISDPEDIWQMTANDRDSIRTKWLQDMKSERARKVADHGSQFNALVSDIEVMIGEKGRRMLKDCRVIGCTTTAAAKYAKDIQSASPDVVIVEEAGEILESHILTSLSPTTKQLILIGDHKQLRPKSHYELSVEKGTGYDLNRSLFERLVLKGFPHQVLLQQHRMRPEISALVRSLTYPDLADAQSTEGRPAIRGLQDNLVFINHDVLENEVQDAYDPRDGGTTPTKKNDYEANMILKCVKYLAQQGYGSDDLVVLTPYLGQLRLLYDVLAKENDPVLNDLDSYDLVRAGLLPQATAHMNRQRLRVSTVDNYQGEESNIVIVCLTRSNPNGDIGFMTSPERLNVLLSRARNGLIIIGNSSTFLEARKQRGRELWAKFFDLLKQGGHIYHGFPVKCERHADRTALITAADQFEKICPDGGCDAPCHAMLSCNRHTCPQKCHQIFDHSKMRCEAITKEKCARGHQVSWKCFQTKPSVCPICAKEARQAAKRLKDEHDRQVQEFQAQHDHEARMAAVEDQIEAERQRLQQTQLTEDRDRAYEQRKLDLCKVKELASTTSAKKPVRQPNGPSSQHSAFARPAKQSITTTFDPKDDDLNTAKHKESPATQRWAHMKQVEQISNSALDELMQMTGLESVKIQFINILEKLQTSSRQGTDMKQERLGTVMLGNPGTGKTTVARIYARFLAEVGAISSAEFVETTGAKVANDGVNNAKQVLEALLKKGGGVIFIDEAYQLVSGNSYGGGAVLDYLLAEIENTTGKLVFMFAGYDKQMEKFFQHNPGLPSRMPIKMKFADYSEQELLEMLQSKIHKKYKGRMQVEDGYDGLYMRIVVRRLHSQSGHEGFGNARALENVLSRITDAQSGRLTSERRSGIQPDDFVFTKTDLIGPEPSQALLQCSAWMELQGMIGLQSVKASVETMLDRIQANYVRELREKKPIQVSLNRLFVGSPGTGKTTVAKLYGQILADIGLLSSSECVLKTPSDFIGNVMGGSESQTKSILENTKGKVLVIDEAYMLGSTLGNVSAPSDPYRTAVVDTLVSEVQSTPGEDRAVLLLGYEKEMKDMLLKVNPGLTRRFPLDNAFHFEDYNDEQLFKILNYKMNKQDLGATEEAKQVAISLLSKLRRRPNFGNAGEVENILSKGKDNYALRQQKLSADQRLDDVLFEPQDFDPAYARGETAPDSIQELFKDVVGSDDLVSKLEGYTRSFNNALDLGMQPEELIPFNFVFKGPPGKCRDNRYLSLLTQNRYRKDYDCSQGRQCLSLNGLPMV